MSCTMKINPQGRSFRISSRSQTSGLVSEVMGSYLPTLEATKAIAMVCNVWEVSRITMINSSKEGFSYLPGISVFLSWPLTFGRNIVSQDGKIILIICIFTYWLVHITGISR